jgi:hypothetical protein
MKCKTGYEGVLCATCSDGYFKSVRDCALCERVRIGELVAFVVGALLLLAILIIAARKSRSYFDFSAIWSHVKILVSFLTV